MWRARFDKQASQWSGISQIIHAKLWCMQIVTIFFGNILETGIVAILVQNSVDLLGVERLPSCGHRWYGVNFSYTNHFKREVWDQPSHEKKCDFCIASLVTEENFFHSSLAETQPPQPPRRNRSRRRRNRGKRTEEDEDDGSPTWHREGMNSSFFFF